MSMQDGALDKLTDKQKSLLTQLAYIDFNGDKLKGISLKGSVTISDLAKALKNENLPYLGNVAKKVTGIRITQKDVIKELEKSGLGNIRIRKISRDLPTGFFAIAFEDEIGNRGMTFRGTDVSNISELIKDSITDVKEYITDNDAQIQKAKKFFKDSQNKNGLNYLYGHSLGGNLVEHIYLENYEDIKNAFTINPNHINQDLLNTEEKIEAFNNPNKFSCFVIGGDWVSELKECNLFENNIKYVRNNNKLKHNILSDHEIDAAMYDENGDFLIDEKQKTYHGHNHKVQRLVTKFMAKLGKFSRNIFTRFNSLEKKEEIKALPTGKTENDFNERIKLDNFESIDKMNNADNAIINDKSDIDKFEYFQRDL